MFVDSECLNREWAVISIVNCTRYCWASGDAHYKTFDDKFYQFEGHCTYYLVRTDRFAVTTHNIPCGITSVVCMKSVTIEVQLRRYLQNASVWYKSPQSTWHSAFCKANVPFVAYVTY